MTEVKPAYLNVVKQQLRDNKRQNKHTHAHTTAQDHVPGNVYVFTLQLGGFLPATLTLSSPGRGHFQALPPWEHPQGLSEPADNEQNDRDYEH